MRVDRHRPRLRRNQEADAKIKQTIKVTERDAQGNRTGAMVDKQITKGANQASAAATHELAWAAQELNARRVQKRHTEKKIATENNKKAKREVARQAVPETLKKIKLRDPLGPDAEA